MRAGPTLGRRAFLAGTAALLLVPRLARAERPVVLVLSSGASPRSAAVLDAFKARSEGVTRVSYELGPDVDAAAFLADGIRELEVSAVFALGDRAFVAAVREFTTVPLVYADVTDTSPASGRSNVVGLSLHVDPARSLQKLKETLPRLQTLGVLRGQQDSEPAWWAALEVAASSLGVSLVSRAVGTAADVSNASAALLASADAIWPQPDPRLWTGSVVSRLLFDAQLARKPVIGLDRSWILAANPAPFAFETSARGVGEAAAAETLRAVGLGGGAGEGGFPEPWLVGSKSAMRAIGLALRKDAAARVDEWLD